LTKRVQTGPDTDLQPPNPWCTVRYFNPWVNVAHPWRTDCCHLRTPKDCRLTELNRYNSYD